MNKNLVNMAVGEGQEGVEIPGAAVIIENKAGKGKGKSGQGKNKTERKPKYPWGLSLTLTSSEMDKLGVDTSMFRAGDQVTLQAVAKVRSVAETDYDDPDVVVPDSMLELQITDMSMDLDMGFEGAWDEAVATDMAMDIEDSSNEGLV